MSKEFSWAFCTAQMALSSDSEIPDLTSDSIPGSNTVKCPSGEIATCIIKSTDPEVLEKHIAI